MPSLARHLSLSPLQKTFTQILLLRLREKPQLRNRVLALPQKHPQISGSTGRDFEKNPSLKSQSAVASPCRHYGTCLRTYCRIYFLAYHMKLSNTVYMKKANINLTAHIQEKQ